MFNLSKSKIDLDTYFGTWWELAQQPDGRLEALPLPRGAQPGDRGCVLVAPPGIAYTRALERLKQHYIEEIRTGTLTDAQDAAIRGTALVEGGVILDWANLSEGDKVLVFTPKLALSLLTSLAWSNFRALIESIADNRRVLLAKEEEQAKGNSQPESSGSSETQSPTGSKSS